MANYKGSQFNIDTSINSGRVTFIEQDLMRYERVDFNEKERLVVDTFGPSWLLAWTEFSPHSVNPVSGNKKLRLVGLHMVFVPSYTLAFWHIHPGKLDWKAMVSSSPLVGIDWKQPILFKIDTPPTLESKDAISDFLRSHLALNPTVFFLEPQLNYSRISRIAKEYLDLSFREEMTISQLAEDLGQNHIVLTRNFTKAYGMSPLKYRQRLRLFEALNLMNQGASVTEAIFASGFTCLSEFNRQFKSTLGTNPRSFSPLHQCGKKTEQICEA